MWRLVVVVVGISLIGSVAAAGDKNELILDVPDLVGATVDDVNAKLGDPSDVQSASCHGSRCPRLIYRGGEIEIVFVRGKADWITVFPKNVAYDREALRRFGLPVQEPTFSNRDHMRWNGTIHGYKEVALFPGGRLENGGAKLWYFYAYASTLP